MGFDVVKSYSSVLLTNDCDFPIFQQFDEVQKYNNYDSQLIDFIFDADEVLIYNEISNVGEFFAYKNKAIKFKKKKILNLQNIKSDK